MTSRTRHMLMMAAMVFVVIPFAMTAERPWQIAVIAALGGMVLGEHGAALTQEERERRKQSGADPTRNWTITRNPRTRLTLSSVLFAMLGTATVFVMWNEGLFLPGTTPGVAGTVALVIAGGIAGLLWHWQFGKWFREFYGFDRDYRRTPNS